MAIMGENPRAWTRVASKSEREAKEIVQSKVRVGSKVRAKLKLRQDQKFKPK